MVKAKETNGKTDDWVELLRQENESTQEVHDKSEAEVVEVKNDNSIQNFIAQKIEENENTNQNEKEQNVVSEKIADRLSKLEDEGFNIYYDLDSFNGSDTYQSKRYVGAIFNKVDSNMEVLAIVTLEYDPEDKSKEELKENFELFKDSLKTDENNISVRFSIQNLNGLTSNDNIDLINKLMLSAIEKDPELNKESNKKKKEAVSEADSINADEIIGDEHFVNEEIVSENPNRRKKIKL